MEKVLILGAGLVSKPMVDYLLSKGFFVRVATRTVSKAEALTKGHKNGESVQWTADDKEGLTKMVKDSSLVVSLLPYAHHPDVAEICIQEEKNMVTTSYVSEKMSEMDGRAGEANIIILNEIGLDPGIDHMSAMKIIDDVHSKKGVIESFRSVCGALPSPEASNNPFRYKFSWSPRGVAFAGRNSARYLIDGKEIKIPGKELFKDYSTTEIPDIGRLEVYPNRDSIPYIEKYGIKDVNTMFRGTLRYSGWCDLWYNISRLGLLDTEEKEFNGMSYKEFMKSLAGAKADDIRGEAAKYLGINKDSEILDKIEWLSLFSDDKIKIEKGGNIDVFVEKLLEKLQYKDGERDMVILKDEFIVRYINKREKIISTLIDFGVIGEDTAIARTVSLPAAVAVKLIIEGEIKEKGVHIPTKPDIYEPVLRELETLGISFREDVLEI